MQPLKRYFITGTYYFNEPFVYHFKNDMGEDCGYGRFAPWCSCRYLGKETVWEPAGNWMVCSVCKQPDKETLTECPKCQRLWRGPRPNFPFQLECYECE